MRERADQLRDLDRRLRSDFAARVVGELREVVMELDPLKPTGLTEDFLSVSLPSYPGKGRKRVQIISSRGMAAQAVFA